MNLARMAAVGAALITLSLMAMSCGGGGDDSDDGVDVTPAAATATRPAPAGTSTPEAEDTSEPAASPTGVATSMPPTSVPATAAPSVDALAVSAGDFAFSPNAIIVTGANDTKITMTNTGSAPHTMTVYRDQAFTQGIALAQTQPVAGGASDDFTLSSADIGAATQLFFRCEVHPSQMQGTIAVQ